MKLNLKSIKSFLYEILGGSVNESMVPGQLPDFVKTLGEDTEEIDDYRMSEIIEDNFYKYENLSMPQKRRVCHWWNSFWSECCELIGGDISEAEMIQQISEEGFIFA